MDTETIKMILAIFAPSLDNLRFCIRACDRIRATSVHSTSVLHRLTSGALKTEIPISKTSDRTRISILIKYVKTVRESAKNDILQNN